MSSLVFETGGGTEIPAAVTVGYEIDVAAVRSVRSPDHRHRSRGSWVESSSKADSVTEADHGDGEGSGGIRLENPLATGSGCDQDVSCSQGSSVLERNEPGFGASDPGIEPRDSARDRACVEQAKQGERINATLVLESQASSRLAPSKKIHLRRIDGRHRDSESRRSLMDRIEALVHLVTHDHHAASDFGHQSTRDARALGDRPNPVGPGADGRGQEFDPSGGRGVFEGRRAGLGGSSGRGPGPRPGRRQKLARGTPGWQCSLGAAPSV